MTAITRNKTRPRPSGCRRLRIRHAVGAVMATLVLTLGVPSAWSYAVASPRIVDRVSVAPDRSVTLVMGAGVRPSGRPSRLLAGRLDVAAELHRAGRTDTIVVSGTVGPGSYDEPATMTDYLVDAGVARGVIIEDPAGINTRATCENAPALTGEKEFTIVTQQFHLPRAIAICRDLGLDVVGVPHDSSVDNWPGTRTGYAREVFATVPAMWRALFG